MNIEFKNSKTHNLGVFATKTLKVGEIIETCPVVVLSRDTTKIIDGRDIDNYTFFWEEDKSAIALGCGSLYNHHYEPNARYCKELEKNILTFKAIKPIKKGEEITINYNGNPADKTPVWFHCSPAGARL